MQHAMPVRRRVLDPSAARQSWMTVLPCVVVCITSAGAASATSLDLVPDGNTVTPDTGGGHSGAERAGEASLATRPSARQRSMDSARHERVALLHPGCGGVDSRST
jgi:hypothetical protein